jgi:type IV pilus assembly protein PilQ
MKTNWPAFRFGCLLLASSVLTAIPAGAQQPREAAASAATLLSSISNVEVSRIGQATTVQISATRDLRYQASQMENPPRIVLDFSDTRIAVPKNTVSSEISPVERVRMGESASGHSRVVIDLTALMPYSVKADGPNITVSFADSQFVALPTAIRPIATHSASTARPLNLKPMKVPEMPLPAWLTGMNLSFATPIPQPPAQQPQTRAIAPAQILAGQAAPPPQGAPVAQTASAVSASGPRYSGDPISVNLKDVDLKDFFRLIHEISGLNVVLDPSVHGTVTLVLDEVPWDQALDIVLRNNGLDKEISGNVLRIVTQDTLKHEADAKRELAKAQSDAIEPVTTTRVLSYAKATLLVPTVKPFLTARGTVFADVRSNTLIVSDIPASMPKIDNLLRELDRKGQQVEIDARVVAASRTFARDIGTQLAYSLGPGNSVIGGGFAVGTSPISRLVTPPFSSPALITGTPPTTVGSPTAVTMPLATNLPAVAPTSGLTYAFTSPNFALDFMLTAMESHGVGKVLSEPKGVTQNNEKLTVKQGTQIPIQTSINNTISVQYVDAVLKLEVTPQITSEGTVFLDVTVENTSIDQGIAPINGTPALDTQSTQTKVLINDGGTIVVGGVIINSQNTTINQVPVLGSLPLIGNLFKRQDVNVSSQELLFFVTPRILPG